MIPNFLASSEMAGAEGFEPPKAVLETAGLPLAYAPIRGRAISSVTESLLGYFVSRCGWCLRQNGQNFFSSIRSVVVRLFLVLL